MSNGVTINLHLNDLGATIDGPMEIKGGNALVVVTTTAGAGLASVLAHDPAVLESFADVCRSAATKLRVFIAEQELKRAAEPRAEIINITARRTDPPPGAA
jgi:hypothetical protein